MGSNIVIRKCLKCGFEGNESDFSYHGDGVWGCPKCVSMWTEVSRIIDPDDPEDNL